MLTDLQTLSEIIKCENEIDEMTIEMKTCDFDTYAICAIGVRKNKDIITGLRIALGKQIR